MDDRNITVGASVSVSGMYQRQGQQALNGMQLWQRWINTQRGITVGSESRPVRLIWHDDEGRSVRARENLFRLLQQDRVDILIGPYSSNLTMAAAEISEEYKKVLWNYGGTSDGIFSRGWKYVVGISSPASEYFRALPRYLAKQYPELRRVCVLYSGQGTFAREITRGIIESAQETSHSVHSIPLNNSHNRNADAVISIIHDLKPEALVLAGSFRDELAIMHTRSHWPNTVRAIASVGAGIAEFSSELGYLSDGIIGPSQWDPGLNFSSMVGPSSDWFVNAFQTEFGTTPNYVSASAFATGLILAECIRQAASLDSDSLRAAASRLECYTFYGRFKIDPQSGKQIGHRILLVRWGTRSKAVLAA